ncbi:tetraspanin-8-like [Silene latifolia]|uniref:tetraspanin-8-like n=1 Tax=Silene latifolia TaxID=37657 RepID=UPI003D78790C
MAKLSNIVITTLNLITTVLSLVAIAIFVYLHFINGSPTHCQRMVEWPVLIMGLTLLVISLMGLIGSSCRISSLLWIYLVVLVALILGWFIFTAFVFFVTNKGVGQAVSGVGYKEYKIGDYSHWLQKHVVNGKNWDEIRSCLVDAKVCKSLDVVYDKHGDDFLKFHLSPIQSSCCKPPTSCGFTPKNATYWETPKTGPATSDPDCQAWNNDQKKLCYDCKTCKGGVLANLRKEWRNFLIVNVIIIVFLFVVYMVGCCAVRNSHRLPKYRPTYP